MGSPRIGALLTSFNRRELTLACLRSIERQRGHDAKIVTYLVDDASSDGTAEAVAAEFPEVRLLHGDGQQYWNGGMRMAFAEAQADGYDAYLWLNDDTRMDDDAVATLLGAQEWIDGHGHAPAIVAGSTRHPDDPERLTYGGRTRPDPRRPLHFALVPPDPERPRPVETCNGNCVLVPSTVAESVGNLDPAFRQQMGDFDYGLRARAAGFGVWIAPGTIGECAPNPDARYGQEPLADELRQLWSVKLLEPTAWRTFTRRHAGPLWPLYFASPYVRGVARVVAAHVRERVRRG